MNQTTPKKRINKKISVFLAIIFIIASFFCGFLLRGVFYGRDRRALNEAVFYLKEYGVFDTKTLELKNLTEQELAKILVDSLSDDYAKYYNPEEYKKIKQNAKGNYQGVGLGFKDGLVVKKVQYNSPAHHAGILVDDRIISATFEEKTTEINSLADFNDYINKRKSTDVFVLSLIRNGSILRVNVSAKSYEATYVSYMDSEREMYFLTNEKGETGRSIKQKANPDIPSDVGYIKFTSFEGNAFRELEDALEFFKECGKSKLIFDLRDNGGGYMRILSDVASLFISNSGKSTFPIAYELDNDGEYEVTKSSSNKYFENIKAVSVIANENTASASECLIGAMLYYKDRFSIDSLIIENQDYQNTARTYGKGIMQTTYPLSNGGAIKLTTAVVYQPDKTTCIHGTGILATEQNSCKKADNVAIKKAIQSLN